MKITKLLKINDRYSGTLNSLDGHFGDSYLMNKNYLYRSIRERAIKLGYKYSKSDFERFYSFPLASLPWIVAKKKIPYIRNEIPLREITLENPKISLDTHYNLFTSNYTLHESAHCCAFSITEQTLDTSLFIKTKQNGFSEEKLLALKILIEESFANTCDLMAWSFADNPVHFMFLKYNSYCQDWPPLFKSVKWKNSNRQFYFIVFILFYLHSNYLYDGFNRSTLERVCQLAQKILGHTSLCIPKVEFSNLLKTLDKDMRISPEFRLITGEFYFQLKGIKTNLESVLDFDFLNFIEKNDSYQICLKNLVKVALG